MRHVSRIETAFRSIQGCALDKHCNENTSSITTHYIPMIAREKHFLDVVIRVAFNCLSYILLEEGWLELASTFIYCYSVSERLESAYNYPRRG